MVQGSNRGQSSPTERSPGSDAPAAVQIYDTTLRDGSQREGISLSCDDKLRIVERLDRLGIAVIEGGWPGSNPKDEEFFRRIRELELEHAEISAFGATRRVGIGPEDDANLRALVDSGVATCTLVGKSSAEHVREVLKTTLDDNLRLIEDSVAFLIGHGRHVVFDAEHLFDGYRADPAYALDTLRAAGAAGAATVTLCDTNGGSLPWQVAEITAAVSAEIEATLGIHAHDDSGCAVANTLAAVTAGATLVQGTINGYGERCGNANLCTIIPNLELKMGRRALPPGRLAELADAAHLVAEVANLSPDHHQPYVGRSAFAHKGGLHAAAVRRSLDSYQHIDPAVVGNQTRFVVSELAGRGSLISEAEQHGLTVDGRDHLDDVLSEIKRLEARGFSFEAAGASVAMRLARSSDGYAPPFQLIDYTVYSEHREGRGMVTEATVKVRVGEDVVHTAAEGNGPVHALDQSLRKALLPSYPAVDGFRLADYKVRILDGGSGTAATVRVLIDTDDGQRRWSTVGASTNIIDASWWALADGIEYGLKVPPATSPTPHRAGSRTPDPPGRAAG